MGGSLRCAVAGRRGTYAGSWAADGWRGRAAGRRTRSSRRAGAGAGSAAGPAAGAPGWLSSGAACFRPGGLGGDVHVDGFERLGGDALAAVKDGLDRSAADQPQQCADRAAGPLAQVEIQARERARDVPVQPQAVFQGGDQAAPLGVAGERPGPDHPEPPCDLLAAGAGEQAAPLEADPGVDEGGRDALGEILEGVGGFGAVAGGQV
jgi:hypothetical protein